MTSTPQGIDGTSSDSRQRVAVVGVGSVGGVFASELLLADHHDITLCARRPFSGLHVASSQVPASHPDVEAVTDPLAIEGPYDWVLLVTKAHQIDGAKAWLDVLCGPSTRLIVIQNGLEQKSRGQAAAPDAAVIPGVVYCGASVDRPGRIVHSDRCTLFVPPGADGEAVVELFEGTRATIQAGSDYYEQSFQKFLVNILVNGPCAIADEGGGVYRVPEMLDLAAGLIDEVLLLAQAEGVSMPADTKERTVSMMGSLPPGMTPSMLQDRRAENAFEHDAISGAALRLAAQHDILVPHITAMHAFLAAIDPGRVRETL